MLQTYNMGKTKFSHFAKVLKQHFQNVLMPTEIYIANGGRFIPEDLNEIISYHRIIACSTAECERGFSSMNLIVTNLRSRILVQYVSSLLFIKLNGRSFEIFKSEEYVKTWLRSYRSADDTLTKITINI